MTTPADDKESHLRSLLKAATYRVLGTATTAVIAWWVTRDLTQSLIISGIEPVAKTLLYYLHERAWQQVPRGRVRRLLPALRGR